jgi:O-Antigen ligase
MALATRSLPLAAPAPAPSPALQKLLAVVVAAAAIKTPLDIPLYFNAGLMLLGLATLVVVQSLQRIFLWMLAMIAVGVLSALVAGSLGSSGPRLIQLLLIVLACSLIARLDPLLLGRYLALLLPVIVLILLVEGFWPEPLFHTRMIGGYHIHRQGGLHGEPNYSAVLYGVIGVILAQHRPRVLGLLPFLLAVPMLSRGVLAAAAAWLGCLVLGRRGRAVAVALVVLICLQPLVVLWFDANLSDPTRIALTYASNGRYGLWLGYAQMGLSSPLGVGYFEGEGALADYAWYLPPGYPVRYAHSVFLQVFGEFGWLGYLMFAGFLIHVALRVARWAPEALPVLVFALAGYALVNGLSDWAFWVAIGYVLAVAWRAEQQAVP